MLRTVTRRLRRIMLMTLLCVAAQSLSAQSLPVVASFSVLADMVREVGGPHVEVFSLVGPNADSHVFDPTPADAKRIASAKLVFVNGLGFEGWLDRLVKASGYRGPIVVVSKGVSTPPERADEHVSARAATHKPVQHTHGALDPHAWQNLANAALYVQTIRDAYDRKATLENPDALRGLERSIILNAVDRLWQDHLYAMDGLREAVYLRAFGQKEPLVEYKNDAYGMFLELMDSIKAEILNNLFRSTTNLQAFEQRLASLPQNLLRADPAARARPAAGTTVEQAMSEDGPPAPKLELPIKRELPKVGRNDPCPCGSGKKFKSCCGRTA